MWVCLVQNLLFWKAVEDYRTVAQRCTPEQRVTKAQAVRASSHTRTRPTKCRMTVDMFFSSCVLLRRAQLYTAFIDEQSPNQVNLPASIVTVLQKNLQPGSSNSGAGSAGAAVTHAFYDQAQLNVFNLMSSDSFRRYLCSPLYQRFLREVRVG